MKQRGISIFVLMVAIMAMMVIVACGGTGTQETANLSGDEIRAEVLGRARLVEVNVVFEGPLAEMIFSFGIERDMNVSRAQEKMILAIEALGPEATEAEKEKAGFSALELYEEKGAFTVQDILQDNSLRQEAIDRLPLGSKVFENDMVHIPVPQSALGFGEIPIMPLNIGMLSEDSVVMPSTIQEYICRSISPKDADSFLANFTMHANSELEDHWKKEVLFDGTVRDLCDTNSEHSPKIDEKRSMAIFKRPANKVFQLPNSEPIVIGSVKGLVFGDILYFAHFTDRGTLDLSVGLFKDIIKNNMGDDVILFSGEFKPLIDGGTTIYHVGNKLELVAFTGMSGSIGIEAEFMFAGLQDIPHVLGESILNEQVEVDE